MDRRERVELKIAMEFGVGPRGATLPAATANADGQPRLLVSTFDGETVCYVRADVSQHVRDELLAIDPALLMRDEQRVKAILAHDAPCEKVYILRWYTIDSPPDPSEYPDVTIRDSEHVVVVDGKVVAWARTDQETDRAAEVSIETDIAYRRRGYARQVTASWAARILAAGKVAYYSHLQENAASRAVAESLGLTFLSDEIEYL